MSTSWLLCRKVLLNTRYPQHTHARTESSHRPSLLCQRNVLCRCANPRRPSETAAAIWRWRRLGSAGGGGSSRRSWTRPGPWLRNRTCSEKPQGEDPGQGAHPAGPAAADLCGDRAGGWADAGGLQHHQEGVTGVCTSSRARLRQRRPVRQRHTARDQTKRRWLRTFTGRQIRGHLQNIEHAFDRRALNARHRGREGRRADGVR